MLENDLRKQLLDACGKFMLPIARMALNLGIGYREFSEVTKKAFVRVATEEYGLRGRPTNTSRVAVMTGLTRKEVKRLKDTMDEPASKSSKMGPASTVLHFWYKDSEFLDADGKPLNLPRDGERASFEELARKYGGDVPPGALLSELIRSGSVISNENETLTPVSRFFLPAGGVHKFLNAVAFSLENLAQTSSANIAAETINDEALERFVWSDRIDEETAEKFKELAKEKSIDLLEFLDDWIAANQIAEPTGKRVGLGLYLISGPHTEA